MNDNNSDSRAPLAAGTVPSPPPQQEEMHENNNDALSRGRSLNVDSPTGSPRSPQRDSSQRWQPIATAPKQGEILVYCRNRAGLPGIVVAHFCDYVEDHPPVDPAFYFWNGGMFTPATKPTHWMPLPEPPQAAAAVASRPFRNCQCPAAPGEDCPLTVDECEARTRDYVGLPWFGERLRRIYDGFVRESASGVVCSIPDTGLETKPHRTWCARCQRRYMELKALVEMLESQQSAAAVARAAGSDPELTPRDSQSSGHPAVSAAPPPAEMGRIGLGLQDLPIGPIDQRISADSTERLINRLLQMSDEQNTRQQAVYTASDIRDAVEREDVLRSAAALIRQSAVPAVSAAPPPADLQEQLRAAIYDLESCDWTEAELFAGESLVSRLDVLKAIRAVFKQP